jgi:hypothetical protein
VWLFIVGLALTLALVAGEIPSMVGAGLLAAYLALVLAVTGQAQFDTLRDLLPRPGARPAEATEVAREAAARARSQPAFDPLIQLLDIGLIVDEQRPDGLALRRGRFISMDDDGIRPFAIVDVPAGLGERLARVRFEIRDETGAPQYVYEDEKWLRPGENIVLPDYRLPVRTNTGHLLPGTWNAHFSIDGGRLGIHNFNLSSSLVERRRRMGTDGELRERVWRSDDDTSLPLSLEELLRQQSRQRNQG